MYMYIYIYICVETGLRAKTILQSNSASKNTDKTENKKETTTKIIPPFMKKKP